MIARIRTGALAGIDGRIFTAEVDVSRGLPGFHLVGLPNTEVRESRERVTAALRNSGVRVPVGRITVNLAPAGIRKEGASFDLAIAMGTLAAGRNPSLRPLPVGKGRPLLVGELSLSGDLRPVRGLLAIALAAVQEGIRILVVPLTQVWEAALVPGVTVVGVQSLKETIHWWRHGTAPAIEQGGAGHEVSAGQRGGPDPAGLLAGLAGQGLVCKAAVIALAGGHNMLLVGPPGTGKTRLAGIIARLQPNLDPQAALEVTRIHSAAGTLSEARLMTRRPFRAPHHTVSRVGLVGGGPGLRPGEITLAHGGLLFLDELPEFAPGVLDALREPLEEATVNLVRGAGARTYPADFQLVAAMNPCRCGYLGSTVRPCRCRPGERERYWGRLSGPLLDRFELFVEVGPWKGAFLAPQPRRLPAATRTGWRWGPTADVLAASVSRLGRWRTQGLATRLEADGAAFLDASREPLGLSLRGVQRCLRVAATIAVLEGEGTIGVAHIREALEFRQELPLLAGGSG